MIEIENKILILPRILVIPFILSMSVLIVFFTFIEGKYAPFYYIIMVAGVGQTITKYQHRLSQYLQNIQLSSFLRFMLLGYAAVVFEEIIVGTIYTLQEGFGFLILFERILQFVSFNLLAFTGFLLGAYCMSRQIVFRPIDIFIISGGWGLFSERIIFLIPTFPIAGIPLILPTMAVYSIILSPAFLSLKPTEIGKKLYPFWKKFILTLLLMFVFSLVPVGILVQLRTNYPLYFPSCEYIPCDGK